MRQTPNVGPPALPEEPPAPGEATCFYNPNKRAARTCSHCGVFVSEAWSAQWGAEHVCLKCLDELRNRRKDPRFEVRRVLWDNVALGTALLPFVLCLAFLVLGPVGLFLMVMLALPSSLITAPLALGFTIYAWKKPRSLVPRGPWRLVWALVLSLLQCGAWGTLLVSGIRQAFLR